MHNLRPSNTKIILLAAILQLSPEPWFRAGLRLVPLWVCSRQLIERKNAGEKIDALNVNCGKKILKCDRKRSYLPMQDKLACILHYCVSACIIRHTGIDY